MEGGVRLKFNGTPDQRIHSSKNSKQTKPPNRPCDFREQPDSCVSEPAKPQPAAWQALVSLWNHPLAHVNCGRSRRCPVGWVGCRRQTAKPTSSAPSHPRTAPKCVIGGAQGLVRDSVPTQHPLKTDFRSRGRSWSLGVLGRGLGSAQSRTTRGKSKTWPVRAAWTVDLHHSPAGSHN